MAVENQVPTNKLERELRKLYLQWLGGMSKHEDDVPGYISQFEKDSRALITKLGGQTASLGALAGFPVPQTLELSPHAGTIYDAMQQAAIQSSIVAGLNSTDAARQILNAGLGQSFNKLNRLARTETVSAYWKNQWDSVADLPLIVMVWGAEGGHNTCDYCLHRDGLVVEDGNIRDHPNGRCTLIPTLRTRLQYKGTLEPDGSISYDPKYGPVQGHVTPLPERSKPTQEQLSPISAKTNPVALSKAQAAQQVTPGAPAKVVKAKLETPVVATVPALQPRIIKSIQDMEDFAKGMPTPASLLPNAATRVDQYTHGVAYGVNSVLRKATKDINGVKIDQRTKDFSKAFTKDVDKMMDKSLVPEDVRVVRTVRPDAFAGVTDFKDLVGSIYSDNGYMSTSLAEKTGGDIYHAKDGVDMEIAVPKGTRGLYLAGDSHLKNERELLLDRGTKLAIQSATFNERTGKWLLKATVVPSPR